MPEKIMIIDDDRAIAMLTSIWVRSAGYEPLIANDGPGGLAAIARHRPTLVLLDIRMPEMDGFEVNRRMRASQDIGQTPVIFLSAHAQEATRQESLNCGGRCFLPKPYEAKNLIAAINDVLSSRSASEGNPSLSN